MSKDDESLDDGLAGFVSVVFARNMDEAERLRELLEDHDIPALVGTSDDIDEQSQEWQTARRKGMTHGVPVLVPDALLDEASEVIADAEDTTGLEEDEEDDEDEDDDETDQDEDPDRDDDDEDEDDDEEEDEDEDEDDGFGDEDDEDDEFGDDDLFGDADEEEEDEEPGDDDE